jgi:dTDP-4-dehydrorhamnose reductase
VIMPDANLSVLITGASGQLGRSLSDMTPEGMTLHAFSKRDFDITNSVQIERIFDTYDFDFCVNCAAFTGVDLAESRGAEAYQINAKAVQQLASACRLRDKTLIQISSDYVYDNGITRPLVETDRTEPKSLYASSKLQGDLYALYENPKTIVLRTSWLYSEHGKNFVHTMLRMGHQQNELRVVSDQHGIPTYARDLASAVFRIILSGAGSFPYGVYHFANSGPTTWSEFAKVILEKGGVNTSVIAIGTKDYPTPAKRPPYSVLDSTKFSKQFSFEIRHWRDALDECLTRIALISNTDN